MAKAEEQIDWERQREQVRFASPMDFSETQESLASASLLLHSSPSHPEKTLWASRIFPPLTEA
jgi:hypothetical protein